VEAAELAGTVVFAISGVIAVIGHKLDWFGALVVGTVTAIGGGTLRDLILGVTPVTWIAEEKYLFAALIGAAVATLLARPLRERPPRFGFEALGIADALGLALFTVVGAGVALDLGFDGTTAIASGVLTGTGGGVIRDLLAGRQPLIMSGEVYATAAIAGAVTFVILYDVVGIEEAVAGIIGGALVFGLRVAAIERDWRLPELGS
jgi:uncharacterized membrane protein YeiH